MKYILLVLFTAFSISLNAQMSPPTVTRSGNSLTQQDSYLTVAKRLGIPTSATDDLDAAVTAQNSIKLLYNTTLQELRIYNPLTLTWSSVGGDNIYTSDGEATEFRNATFPDGLVIGRDIDNDLLAFYPGGYEGKNITGLSSGGNMELVTNDTLLLQSSDDEGLIWFSDGSEDGLNNLNVKFHELPIIGEIDSLEYIYGEGLDGNLKRIETIYISGGGSSYLAKNGIYINSDTIKLGGNITEDTDIPNPDNKFFRVGNPGDAINLNANIPIEFGDFALTYTGFDYVSGTHQSFSGILKGVTFAPLDMEDIDIVGTFTIAGDPFNVTTPDGQIFIDGIWYDEGEVVMNKIVLNFTTSGISMNVNRHSKTEQSSYYEGNNGILNDYIKGDNGKLNRGITNPTTSKLFYETITDTKQKITVDNIELNTNLEVTGNVKLSGVTTGIPINTYGIDASGKVVKFNLTDYLPKTLVEFRGSASYTGTTSESVVYASPAIPSTAWRENGNYILTILGVCQAAQTQNAVIKIYLNTANTLNGSEILINQSHVLTDNTYTPNGGNVLAINLPIFKNTIELLTNKGNSTIANINTGSIFSSNINMTYAKIRTKVTPNFTGNLYLIITTTQSAGSVRTEINNIIFKEI